MRDGKKSISKHESRMATVLESLQEFVLYYDLDMNILYVNESARKAAGLPHEDFADRRCWEIWNNRDTPCTDCPVIAAMTTGEPHSLEKTTDDGKWWIVRGYPVMDDEGTIIGGVETTLEITDRKRMEEELRVAHEILSRSPAAGFVWQNATGWPVSFVTSNVSRIFGHSADDFRTGAVSYVDVIHPDDLSRVTEEVERGTRDLTKNEFSHVPYRIVAKDGTIKWVSDRTAIDRNEEGEAVAYRGIVEDITAQQRAREDLREEKERLAVTLRSIGDAVIATDRDGKIILMNLVAESLTGWNEEDARGRSLVEVFTIVNEDTREPCKNPVDEVLRSGNVVGLANNTVLLSRTGEEHVVADSGAPIRDGEGTTIGVVLVFRDITETRQLEADLQKMEKLRSLGVLAGGIAHDFNNFLAGIVGNVSLAKLDLDPADELFPRLDEMEKAALRARDLTQQLLTFSRGGQPVKRLVRLDELVREAATFALRGSNVRIEFDLPTALRPAHVDEGQIAQVIHNLIFNADQAMPEGGTIDVNAEDVDLDIQSDLALEPGSYVKLTFRDRGHGIRPEHLARVFDPYFTTKEKGSGLGLAIAFAILEKHDGLIRVDSELGVGTTFSLYLPASLNDAVRRVDPWSDVPTGSGRVLVMDDDESILNFSSGMLKRLGFEPALSRDGAEAIHMYKEAMEAGRPFAAVILDLTVPGGMGGLATLTELLAFDPDVKAIVSSGYSNDPVISDFNEYGFKAAVKKPYPIKEMGEALHDILNR